MRFVSWLLPLRLSVQSFSALSQVLDFTSTNSRVEISFLHDFGYIDDSIWGDYDTALFDSDKNGYARHVCRYDYTASDEPIRVFMMRQYLLTFPDEMLDAARIDGASEFGIYWQIVLPNSVPAVQLFRYWLLGRSGTICFGHCWLCRVQRRRRYHCLSPSLWLKSTQTKVRWWRLQQ